jgi:CheY-like chemotaxis protein
MYLGFVSMKTILLTEDEKPLRLVYSASLRECGYRVIEADCGETGLEIARQQLPDTVLGRLRSPRHSNLLRPARAPQVKIAFPIDRIGSTS